MVTLDQLRAAPPPEALETFTLAEIFQTWVNFMLAEAPDWSGSVDTVLFKTLTDGSWREYAARQRGNANIRRSLLAFAEDSDLDYKVRERGIFRQEGEEDDPLRVRSANAPRESPGSLDGIEGAARAYGVIPIVDAQAVGDTQNLNVTCYCLTTNRAALSAAQRAALQIYLDVRQFKIAGTSTLVGSTAEAAYTIEATITYFTGVSDPETLGAAIRTSVYALIANRRNLGDGLSLALIYRALAVPGVENVVLSTPASDIAAAVGQLLTCGQNTTDVVLTLTGV